jgi:NADH dehydrogenase [ubiquinone] 1 alpha subcomplex assembly factor 2
MIFLLWPMVTIYTGSDLTGNTFWEFRDNLSAGRFRRIVQYKDPVHLSDVDVTPQWVQWLRQTRRDPPSLEEQQQDVVRQQNMKILASQADARWLAKPSYLVAPAQQSPTVHEDLQSIAAKMLPSGPRTQRTNQRTVVRQEDAEQRQDATSAQEISKHGQVESLWKSSKKDEPEAWSPKTAKRR